MASDASIYDSVQNYYGEVLKSTKDIKTSACCAGQAPDPIIRCILKKVPEEIKSRYYGCGNAIPLSIEGKHVLDLGSGCGRDCFIAAALVGENGFVTGVDMTESLLQVAQNNVEGYCRTLGYAKPNMQFKKGFIEALDEAGIPDNSQDIITSNCVVNLCPNKIPVFQQAFRVLKEGGEFYFSDMYCDRRLPECLRKNEVFFGEGLGGALYIEDFKRICHQVGFTDPRPLSVREIEIFDPELKALAGNARFYSINFRLFKLSNLETLCEDYGQVAVYKGTMQGHKHSYTLDDHHTFETGRYVPVCGNTASMLSETWLASHFTVLGDRSTHYGVFPCGDSSSKSAASTVTATPKASSSPSPSSSASCGASSSSASACAPASCC